MHNARYVLPARQGVLVSPSSGEWCLLLQAAEVELGKMEQSAGYGVVLCALLANEYVPRQLDVEWTGGLGPAFAHAFGCRQLEMSWRQGAGIMLRQYIERHWEAVRLRAYSAVALSLT
jgi:hypothetical protein